MTPILAALVIVPAPRAYGLGFETSGNEPLHENNYDEWKGIMPVINQQTRVYHSWVNGNEHFYYQDDTKGLNGALQSFAAVDANVREVRLLPGPAQTQTFDREPITYNWNLHIMGGISRHEPSREKGTSVFDKYPTITAFIGGNIELDKIRIPDGVTIIQYADLAQRYLEGLKSTDAYVRQRAPYYLAQLGPHHRTTVQAVIELLQDDYSTIRAAAAKALSGFGQDGRAALPLLRQALNDESQLVREECREAIDRIEAAKDTMSPQARAERLSMLNRISHIVELHRKAQAVEASRESTNNNGRMSQGVLRLYPRFAPAMDGPEFVVEFFNAGPDPVDLCKLLEAESIVFNGQEYNRQVIKFAGNSTLKAGRFWRHNIQLGAFLAGSERLKYSEKLKRWRWRTPIDKGPHSLIVKFAGLQSEPIEFEWNPDQPFLYD
jgi:hypothetical protein